MASHMDDLLDRLPGLLDKLGFNLLLGKIILIVLGAFILERFIISC